MKPGYNTNGLAFHRWQQGIALLAETGYQSVALTVDHHFLDPYAPRFRQDVEELRELLARYGLASVIETGARFLLDPRHKHEPTLLSRDPAGRARRLNFLRRCVDLAAELGSDAVSFWSGRLRNDISRETALDCLAEGCREIIDYARERGVRLAFEPEPGMFIETFADYRELLSRVDGRGFGLTIDVGHVQCVEERPIADCLRDWSDRLHNVHIEDMRRGVHEHLRFGEGEIDFPPVFAALRDIGYAGGLHVELSRHGHMAPEVVAESFEFLRSHLEASAV